MKKNKILLLLAGMLLFGMNTNIINVKAATVNYDYKDTIFGQRTKEEVVKEYSKGLNSGNDTYDPEKKSTYYSKPASIENPYDPGVLTNDTLAAMEGMTNFYRYLAGVESLIEIFTLIITSAIVRNQRICLMNYGRKDINAIIISLQRGIPHQELFMDG